jgi:hypothetical protein
MEAENCHVGLSLEVNFKTVGDLDQYNDWADDLGSDKQPVEKETIGWLLTHQTQFPQLSGEAAVLEEVEPVIHDAALVSSAEL